MYKVSELIGKPLISLLGAKILGTVSNVFFDDKLKNGTFISVFTIEDDCIFLPLKSLTSFNCDAAVVKSEEIVESCDDLCSPINSKIYNQDGKDLGFVSDVIMDGYKTIDIVSGENNYSAAKIIAAGNIVIINDSTRPLKVKPSVKQHERTPVPTISLPPSPPSPLSYDFLKGKRLQRTIIAKDGSVIARQNDRVSDIIIAKAKQDGKLVILALNSL